MIKNKGFILMNLRSARSESAFTLIELLMVVVIIAILASVVFVSLNPVQRYADARNSRRWSDVNSLLTAIHEYVVDNNGSLPSGIATTEKQLGTCTSGGNSICSTAQAACLDLTATLAKYLKTIPTDPNGGSAATTYYSVKVDSNNIVTVKACGSENGVALEVSR